MTINEVFKNSTVKVVIFQIRFPNLFYIEKIVGDYQLRMSDVFYDTSIVLSKGLHVSLGPTPEVQNIEDESGLKTWQFKSNRGFQLNIQSN